MFNLSILTAFGTMICWAFGDFFTQRTAWKVGDMETTALIGLLGAIILSPFVIKDSGIIFDGYNLIFYLFLGIISFLTSWTTFKAYSEGKLSVIEVVLQVALPVTLLLSFTLINEKITITQASVMALIFIGIMLTSIKSFTSLKELFKKIESGTLFGILAAVGWGIINFMTGFSSKNISPLLGLWLPWAIFGLIALIFVVKQKGLKNFFKDSYKFKNIVLGMVIFNTAAWVFYVTATFYNKISISTAITESYPAVALFLDLHFNKVKIKPHQYVGAAIAILATVILAFFV